MTNITVQTIGSYVGENRSWLRGTHGTGPGDIVSMTMDVTKFTSGTHYPNGYLPSGIALGKVNSSGLYGPYDDTASDGRETAAGLLFSSLSVPNGVTQIGGGLFQHGFVWSAKLPLQSGTGSLDADGIADLGLIIFS